LKRHSSENLPCPLFTKEGKFLPFAKGGKEGLEGQCLDNYGLLSKSNFRGYAIPGIDDSLSVSIQHFEASSLEAKRVEV